MKVAYTEIFLEKEDNIIHYYKQQDEINIILNICLFTDKFKEYQRNLFIDFYTKLLEIKDKTDIFIDFKKRLEIHIKEFNTQLKIFQEKINIEGKIEIRGNLQVVYNDQYLSVLIGESSNIIYRNGKLEVVIPNEVQENDRIDVFSEIVEGELESRDKIVSLGCNIYSYITNNEIKEVINSSDIKDALLDLLVVRVEKKEVTYINELNFRNEKIVLETKTNDNIKNVKVKIGKYRQIIGIGIGFLIILFIITSIFLHLSKTDEKVDLSGNEIAINIESLQRQVDTFSKIENTNTEQARQQYQEIMDKLDLYEENEIQLLTIKDLRTKMEQSYYKGFHINIVGENDGILMPIYSLEQDYVDALSGINQLIKTNDTFNIIGQKGAVIGIINTETKGVLQTINIPSSIKNCTNNLSENGVFCYLENGTIYNISKLGVNSVKSTTEIFGEDVIGLGTYKNNRIYTLKNGEKKYISRYMVRSGNTFGSPVNYEFDTTTSSEYIDTIDNNSMMEIDGSFLIWSAKGILQAYRKNAAGTTMTLREIPGWETGVIETEKDLKGKVKIISNEASKYIYLYDYDMQSIVIYLTSPLKTNTSYTNSYKLIYNYKIKFDITDETVMDVEISESVSTNKTYIYILTDKQLYKLDTSRF